MPVLRAREPVLFVVGLVVGAVLATLFWSASMSDPAGPALAVAAEPDQTPPDDTLPAEPRRPRVERTPGPGDPEPREALADDDTGEDAGSVELELLPGLRLSEGSWTGEFEVFEARPWWERSGDELTPVASRALAQAEQAAAAHLSTSPDPDAETVRALLSSPRPTDWESGIVLAARLDPPLVDELVAVVHDPSFGSMRLAAALLLSRLHPVPPELGPALVELSRADDAWQALGAVQLFPAAGDAVAGRALELLRSGGTVAAQRVALLRAAEGAAGFADLIREAEDASVALAVAAMHPELVVVRPDLAAETARRLAVPDARDVESFAWLPRAVGSVDGGGAVLASWLADRRIPWRTREAIAQAVVLKAAIEPTAQRSAATRAVTDEVANRLSDPAEPVPLLLRLLGLLDADSIPGSAVEGALWSAQAGHPSPFVREEARDALRRAGLGGSGSLVVVFARYGIGDDWADVTRELSEAVIGASLRRMADNSIAGDPAPGHRKRLEVEFQHRGRTHRRVVQEGETLVLP